MSLRPSQNGRCYEADRVHADRGENSKGDPHLVAQATTTRTPASASAFPDSSSNASTPTNVSANSSSWPLPRRM